MRIALYQPDIPQNKGNIFRLGACLGVAVDIIEPTGFIFDDKKFKRSAMDYINHLNYKRHLDWEHFFKWVKDNQCRLILMTTKSEKSYYEFKFKASDILLFGRAGGEDWVRVQKIYGIPTRFSVPHHIFRYVVVLYFPVRVRVGERGRV